eukprot:1968326-Karenia_brevis.AAC.1
MSDLGRVTVLHLFACLRGSIDQQDASSFIFKHLGWAQPSETPAGTGWGMIPRAGLCRMVILGRQ